MNLKVAIVFLIVFEINAVKAQRIINTNTNAWINYTGTHKVAEKWSLHLEAQLRRNDFVSKPQQLLLRPGINYHFNSNISVALGYAFVNTSAYGSQSAIKEFDEHRLWQQMQLKSNQGRFEFINRLRLEQRWVYVPVNGANGPEDGPAVFTNRMRIFNKISVPLKGKTIEDKSLYAVVGDEVFINFGKNVKSNIFDQNRLIIGLGYKFPKVGKLEVCYLNQKIYKTDGIKVENNHTLTLSIFNSLSFIGEAKS